MNQSSRSDTNRERECLIYFHKHVYYITPRCSKLQQEMKETEGQLQVMKRQMDKMRQDYEEKQARLQQTASVSTCKLPTVY